MYKVKQGFDKIREKHKRVSVHYQIEIEQKAGLVMVITWSYQPKKQNTTKQQGIYFIRTNIEKAEAYLKNDNP